VKDNINPALTDLVRPIASLIADPRNARQHSEQNIDAIVDSYREHGQQKPIVVDDEGVVIAGNGQLAAAMVLGWEHIAAIPFSGTREVAYAIADNRTAEMATWNAPALHDLVKDFHIDDLIGTGFTPKAIVDVLASVPNADMNFLHDDEFDPMDLQQKTYKPRELKAPFQYYGGKNRLASIIVEMIPKHLMYVEPFAGGAAVFFRKPNPDIERYHEVLNDHNEYLSTFYRVLRDDTDALVRAVSLTPYSDAEYRDCRDNPDSDDDVEKARRFFVNAGQSFSGVLDGGWSRGYKRGNQPKKWQRMCANLHLVAERMSEASIENADALDIIEKYDAPHAFFYCDPPYPDADQGHYGGYTSDDFQKLVDALDRAQGSFILSNYEQPSVDIPDDWERFEIQVNATAMNKKKHGVSKRTEVLWRRINTNDIGENETAVYNSGVLDMFPGGKPK